MSGVWRGGIWLDHYMCEQDVMHSTSTPFTAIHCLDDDDNDDMNIYMLQIALSHLTWKMTIKWQWWANPNRNSM